MNGLTLYEMLANGLSIFIFSDYCFVSVVVTGMLKIELSSTAYAILLLLRDI